MTGSKLISNDRPQKLVHSSQVTILVPVFLQYFFIELKDMKFNANKFELLRNGKEQEIKSATTYTSYDDSDIADEEQVRDLGILMHE